MKVLSERAAAGVLGFLFLIPLPAGAADAVAVNNATVQPAGPLGGKQGEAFVDIVGRDYGSQASFGVWEFDSRDLGLGHVTSVTGLTLTVTQSERPYTNAGRIRICVFLDTDIGLQPDPPEIFFDQGDTMGLGDEGSGGYPRIELSTFDFTPGGAGTADTYTFEIDAGSMTDQYLTGQINYQAPIRICCCPFDVGDSELVAATYAGWAYPEASFRPRLSITAVAP